MLRTIKCQWFQILSNSSKQLLQQTYKNRIEIPHISCKIEKLFFKVNGLYSGLKLTRHLRDTDLSLFLVFLSEDFIKTCNKLCLRKNFDHRSSFINFKAVKRNYAKKFYKIDWIKLFFKEKKISQFNSVCQFVLKTILY